MEKAIWLLLILCIGNPSFTMAQELLSGRIISDASQNAQATASAAFDGNISTCFESGLTSHAWIGYEFPTKNIIRKIRWYNAEGYFTLSFSASWLLKPKNVPTPHSCLAVIEGANEPDFSDGIPIYMITDQSSSAEWHEADINVSRGFKYIRYVGTSCSTGKIAELEFYGEEGDGDDSHFYQPSNLPIVVVHTRDTETFDGFISAGTDPIDKVNELNANFAFISQAGGKIMEQAGTFRLRGNTSMRFDKAPYRIKLFDKQKVFAADYKAKKWTLVPAFDDKSLMRNLIGFDINARTGLEYTPYSRSVDIFVNGEFRGNYQFCDQIEANKNRIDIEEIGDIVDPTDAFDFGWFVEVDAGITERINDSPYFVSSRYSIPVSYKSPDEKELTPEFKNTIQQHFEALEASCLAGNAEQFIDIKSFAQYFIAVEYVCNSDGYHSINLHKHTDNDHFYFGPIWDLNLSLDNDSRTYPINDRTQWSYTGSWADAGNIRQLLYDLFENNPNFMAEVRDTWANLRQRGSFDTNSILSNFDHLSSTLENSQQLNFLRWDMLDRKIFYEPSLPKTWTGEIAILRHALESRTDWMDNMLESQQQNLTIEIPDTRWATVYLPLSFSVPDDLRCYQISNTSDDKLILEKVTITEANKPYLIFGPKGTHTLNGYTSFARDARQLGLLTGTTQDRTAQPGSYTLQTIDGRTGFYRVEEGATINIDATKAYLCLPEASATACDVYYLDQSIIDALDINTDSRYTIEDLTHLIATPDATEFDIQTLRMLILNYKK